ncbi:MAG: hypothetical protein HQL45_15550 [Alphaproteobacteria bacterium]|nr:hypothetical protein [Alphaproteobacteria bacterium]
MKPEKKKSEETGGDLTLTKRLLGQNQGHVRVFGGVHAQSRFTSQVKTIEKCNISQRVRGLIYFATFVAFHVFMLA